MSPRRVSAVETAMDATVAIRDARRAAAPVYAAALRAGWEAASDADMLAGLLRSAEKVAKRLTGRLEVAAACPDSFDRRPGCGTAA